MNRLAYAVTLSGFFGIAAFLPMWYLWLAPPQHFPAWALLALLMIPLVFPLPGLVKGKAYTYAWSSMLSLLYFAHGISEAWTLPAERWYGVMEILLSLLWFVGAIWFIRTRPRQNPLEST